MFVPPEELLIVLKKSQVLSFKCIDVDDTLNVVICVHNHEIADAAWRALMDSLRLFFKWVQRNEVRYHFVVDTHECESIPLKELYELQVYLAKKKDVLRTWLHSSAVITRSSVVEMVLNGAFELFPPQRPMKIILQRLDPEAPREKQTQIPQAAWDACMKHLSRHKL
jgi:hypothetical protein